MFDILTIASSFMWIVCFAGDKVIFTKSVHSPGVPVIYRAVEERAANPDRLNLDR